MTTFIIVMVLFVVIIIAVSVVSAVKSGKDAKRLNAEGKVILRKGAFFENGEYFTTKATYEDICMKLRNTDLSDTKASIQYDVNGRRMILFRSQDGWNAVLDMLHEEEGKNQFRFYFAAWNTARYGIVTSALTMNVAETAVEKAILALDPAATVETHKMQIKTKSKIF